MGKCRSRGASLRQEATARPSAGTRKMTRAHSFHSFKPPRRKDLRHVFSLRLGALARVHKPLQLKRVILSSVTLSGKNSQFLRPCTTEHPNYRAMRSTLRGPPPVASRNPSHCRNSGKRSMVISSHSSAIPSRNEPQNIEQGMSIGEVTAPRKHSHRDLASDAFLPS